jgi:UDP-N-acetylglucosamine--N-acetylmuramyl-(pentapeptide) pyrophosphoryl-undecaprenol N-acetylglucosamine transferase
MNFVLAAGGTGGHMVPAHALAAELKSRGHGVLLITDERGARFPGLFEGMPVHILPAGRLDGGPIGWLKALRSVIRGRGEAKSLYREHRPDAVVGFGGYPAFPSLLAATRCESRPCFTSRMRCSAAPTAFSRRRRRDRDGLSTGRADEAALSDEDGARRQSGREAIAELGEAPFPPFDELRRSRSSSPAEARARPSEQGRAGRPGPASPSLRLRLQVMQQCRPTTSTGRAATPSSAFPPS